jgi:nitrate reductase assembly molybdenum cofactor insertion protein NarJ
MARLDREWQAHAAEHQQRIADRELAEAHAAWHEMKADGVNVDTRRLDEQYAEMLERGRAERWVAEHAQHQESRQPEHDSYDSGAQYQAHDPDSAAELEPDV